MADEYEILEFMDIDYAYVLVAKQWLLQLLYRRVRNLDKWLHLSPCPNGCKGFSDKKKKKLILTIFVYVVVSIGTCIELESTYIKFSMHVPID